ncbi:hypothetical protein APHAL10511_007014 [Amanita phalloides]|nr:hypothetical protein APHAL10511_007014 [Amanita phalloides]
MSRRRTSSSLKISTRPAQTPIPPSLLTSPYLTSPESIFQREITSPSRPSAVDEQWLQDTVPLDTAEPGAMREDAASHVARRRSSAQYDRGCEHDSGVDISEFGSSPGFGGRAGHPVTGTTPPAAAPLGTSISPPSMSVPEGTTSLG